MIFESYVLDIIEERRTAPLIKGVLKGLSCLFQSVVAVRHFAYDSHLLKTVKVPIPVISVGNIACGGTGKTPFVLFLIKELARKERIAILTRGYRSQDEVHLFKKYLPETLIFVGADRVASARAALRKGAKLLVLDDGMQHRRLERDCEIVLIDAEDPFGKGHFLPRGYLRDLPKRLAKADLIAINHVENEEQYLCICSALAPYSHAPCIGLRYQLAIPESLKGKKVGVFCGLGRPQRFIDCLRNQGIDVVATLFLNDHRAPSKQALSHFEQKWRALGAETLVCTEKDALKNPPAEYISIAGHLELVAGRDVWENFKKMR